MGTTPGEWKIDPKAATRIVSSTGRGVANTGGPTDTTVPDGGEAENQANARLIAAAKGLFAACEAFVACVENPSTPTWEAYKAARTALAKAKGV